MSSPDDVSEEDDLSSDPSEEDYDTSQHHEASSTNSHAFSRYLNRISSITKYDGIQIDTKSIDHWKSVRNVVRWSPFIRIYKKRRYPWVQLAGHQANFRSGNQGTVLKRACGEEENCLRKLMEDPLHNFVPQLKAKVTCGDEEFLELEDLLSSYESPCVMDIKMGIRTYREDELIKAQEKPVLRKDMYDKMVQIDPNEPNDEEHKLGAITKPRYMIWREFISSTASLGFRIDGAKFKDGISTTDYKTMKNEEKIMQTVQLFTDNNAKIVTKYLERLTILKETLIKSSFFKAHELIGSSLLFIHDKPTDAGIWMIDFAKTYTVPSNISISHDKEWILGNHEDGYLIGIDNLIRIFSTIESQLLNNKLNHTESLS